MRSPNCIIALLCLLLITSCKSDKESPGIEQRNEVEEVKYLTDSDDVEDFFDDHPAEENELYNLQKTARLPRCFQDF